MQTSLGFTIPWMSPAWLATFIPRFKSDHVHIPAMYFCISFLLLVIERSLFLVLLLISSCAGMDQTCIGFAT